MILNGAEIVIKCLQEESVECVFGYPGGAVLFIYDALFQQSSVRHILTRHEQAAVHAADGYARSLPDKVGVVIATSGPGVTNAVTGIATAYCDSIPMVIISGQVASTLIGQDAFQEVDAVGITRPCVKHNFLVKDVRDIAPTMKKAFYLARTGRPGPVLVDIPKDVSMQTCAYSYPKEIHLRSYNPVCRAHQGQIRKAIQALLEARQPILCAGGGSILANASEQLAKFAALLDLPVTCTLMGLGAFAASDPRYLGMPGMHGSVEANMALYHADVVLVIGARLDDRVIGNTAHFSEQPRRVIHIDIDPTTISKRIKADLPIVGNIQDVLDEMIHQLCQEGARLNPADRSHWWAQIDTWKQQDSLRFTPSNSVIKPQFVIQKLWEITQGNAFISSDVGQHQMWAAQHYRFDKPRRWLNSGGLGTMGVGLPYAMGAKLAHPEATVACITGDGSIQMNIQELSTCKQIGLPIKICNLNNGHLGMVRQWQEMFHGGRYSETCFNGLPDFAKLAEAYGHVGLRVDKPGDVEAALFEAFANKNELVFLDFHVDPTENVYPMVQAGQGLNEMLLPPSE